MLGGVVILHHSMYLPMPLTDKKEDRSLCQKTHEGFVFCQRS
jgi:hypothetical protein